jgi:glycosyltransferase involved in cell wall biosynthesis/nucleotide-binding universal stress UspA family protein
MSISFPETNEQLIQAVRQTPKTMILLMPESDHDSLFSLAHHLAQSTPVLLLGIVPVPINENLSTGAAAARQLRDLIQCNIDRVNLKAKARIRVSYTPWEDVRLTLAEEPDIDLLILSYPDQLEAMQLTAAELLSHPPCDIALLRGPFPNNLHKILLPNLGDPHAQRALRLSLNLANTGDVKITSLRLRRPETDEHHEEAIFTGMRRVLAEMPDIEQRNLVTENRAKTIIENAREFDLVVMGTKATPTRSTRSFGEITDAVLAQSPAAVITIKTKQLIPKEDVRRSAAGAISILVDRWFAENTFHAEEFANLDRLLALKAERGVTISLVLPALNEEETIGEIILSNQRVLMEQKPLLDEIVLMDSDSTDRTREIAADLGIPVYIHQEVLPQYGSREGKGEALWKSLFVTKGDLIFWVDSDIRNFHPRFVYGLIGPLLYRTKLNFIKGFYRRPLKIGSELKPGRGGRVTELTARPMLNLFYPELSGMIQPLAGEYGGRREILERVPFSSGYGVEIGLLIDIFEKYQLSSFAQVDLLERIHKNQTLSNLSKMSFAIIQTVIRKLEQRYGQAMLEDVNRTMKIIRYQPPQYYLTLEEIAELERPPMIEIPEYLHQRKLIAEQT